MIGGNNHGGGGPPGPDGPLYILHIEKPNFFSPLNPLFIRLCVQVCAPRPEPRRNTRRP